MLTRETKVGLVVAGSFLCLVAVVVLARLRNGDTSTPQEHAQAGSPNTAEPAALSSGSAVVPESSKPVPTETMPSLQRPPGSEGVGIQLTQANATAAPREDEKLPLPDPPLFTPENMPATERPASVNTLTPRPGGEPAPEAIVPESPTQPVVKPLSVTPGLAMPAPEAVITEPSAGTNPVPPRVSPPADLTPPEQPTRPTAPSGPEPNPVTVEAPSRPAPPDTTAPAVPALRENPAGPPVVRPEEEPAVRPAPPPTARPVAASSPGVVAAPAARNRPVIVPEVDSWDEEIYVWRQDDTFPAVSLAKYQTEVYAQALFEFNRAHPQRPDGMRRNPQVVQPGQRIFIPPIRVLMKEHAAAIPAGAHRADAAPPPEGGERTYRVGGNGEMFLDIERKTGVRWEDIYLLNRRTYDPKQPVPAGTVLRLPAKPQTAQSPN